MARSMHIQGPPNGLPRDWQAPADLSFENASWPA